MRALPLQGWPGSRANAGYSSTVSGRVLRAFSGRLKLSLPNA